MNVHLTFDIEVWCNGWNDLDRAFPPSFERYVYGRSKHGEYALPQTLAILNRHGLPGVFFVEPLFAARFGLGPLRTIVQLIRGAGQQVQLHLHPEWTDEAVEPLIENCRVKRQHLSYYTLDEQTALIGHGRRMLEAAGSGPVTAFRAGSFAANRDTYGALHRNGILLDSSLNRCFGISGADLRGEHTLDQRFEVAGVTTVPVTVFRDGLGRDRPAHVGACSAAEMRQALSSARKAGRRDFVIVSHNFEMLRSGTSLPDWIVVRRFEQLCAFLAAHRDQFEVGGFALTDDGRRPTPGAAASPRAGMLATARRHVEQLRRRIPA
ncbi:MAG: polysaccharide deacetylase [Rubrivivax sp.]|nr:polysaccharide deacetylase [Rubrivivax sp.]